MRNRVAVKTDAAIQRQSRVNFPAVLDKAAEFNQRPIDIGGPDKVDSLTQTQIWAANLNWPEIKLSGQICLIYFAADFQRMPPKELDGAGEILLLPLPTLC